MNKVFLIGRMTKDADLRYTPSNVAVATFSIAVDRPFTGQSGQRETDFINITVWRKQAENIKKYLSKGSLIAIDGRIQTRNYDDKDGKKVYVTEVVADNVQFLESKGTSTGRNNELSPADFNEPAPAKNGNGSNDDIFADFGDSIEISDDDIAF